MRRSWAAHSAVEEVLEQDVDIAECLRAGVCNPIADQAESMRSIVEKFGADLPEPLP